MGGGAVATSDTPGGRVRWGGRVNSSRERSNPVRTIHARSTKQTALIHRCNLSIHVIAAGRAARLKVESMHVGAYLKASFVEIPATMNAHKSTDDTPIATFSAATSREH